MLLCCLAFEHPYLAEQLAGDLRFPNLKNGSDFRRPLPFPTRQLTAPANLTVEGWLTRWLEGIRGEVSRATYDGYKRDVRHHIIPELGRRRLKDLSASDIRRLYRKMLDKARGDRLEAFYVLALHTGMRRGELLGLQWSDIDLDATTVRVRRSLDVD